MRIAAFAAGLSLLAAPAFAQEDCVGDPEMDALARAAVEETGAPAAGVYAVRGGDVRVGASGTRVIDGEAPVTVCDLWHIGSNTKSMTALLVARLVERGDITWDDTVGAVLTAHIEGMHPGYAEVTYRHLLSHQSGLPANLSTLERLEFVSMTESDMPARRLEFARRVLDNPPANAPGEGFGYSNAGYVVAGAMLEVVTGESWETLIRREVFDPLGMDSAGFGAPGSTEEVDQPRGHRAGLFGGLVAVEPGPMADNIPSMGPAGTVHVSMIDFARYMQAHLDGARGETADYLSAESWAVLHTPPFGGAYAMGIGFDAEEGRLGHGGSNTLWLMVFHLYPERGVGAGYVFNDGRAGEVSGPGRRALDAALAVIEDSASD